MLNKSEIQISSNRSFGILFSIVFIIIAFWSFRGDFSQIKILPLMISIVFLITGLLNSKFLTPLNKLWIKFGYLLGLIISPIIMGLIFFLVVTPTGIILRILGKDILNIKKKNNKNSYWIKRDKRISKMKKQF